MDKRVIDLASIGVLGNLFHKQELHKIKKEEGLVFLFDEAGELLYIECVTSSLEAAIYKYQSEIEYIGMIPIEGEIASLEMIKAMLSRAYYPKGSDRHPFIKTIHSGCTELSIADRKKTREKEWSAIEGESVSRGYEDFFNSEEAAEGLGISVETLFFYCQHLIHSGHTFRKDLHRRYVFIQEDLLLLEVFVNLLEHGITIKRAAKESVKLAGKFGVQEALRLSKLTAR
jgi:hypothetical protein